MFLSTRQKPRASRLLACDEPEATLDFGKSELSRICSKSAGSTPNIKAAIASMITRNRFLSPACNASRGLDAACGVRTEAKTLENRFRRLTSHASARVAAVDSLAGRADSDEDVLRQSSTTEPFPNQVVEDETEFTSAAAITVLSVDSGARCRTGTLWPQGNPGRMAPINERASVLRATSR